MQLVINHFTSLHALCFSSISNLISHNCLSQWKCHASLFFLCFWINLNVSMYVSPVVYENAYSDPLLFFPAPFCAASDISSSWWFPLHKATVTGTALTCRCVRPTTKGTAGHPQAAAAVLHRETRRRWRVSRHRKQTCNTTSTDMGHRPWRRYDA